MSEVICNASIQGLSAERGMCCGLSHTRIVVVLSFMAVQQQEAAPMLLRGTPDSQGWLA